jgi:hypothetical protein
MSHIRNGLGYRIACSGFAAFLCGYSLHAAGSGHGSGWSKAIAAVAWALFAVAWFLQPLVPTVSLSKSLRQSESLAVGPPKLRAGLGGVALALLVTSILVGLLGVA